MLEVALYTIEGEPVGTIELAEAVFDVPVRPDLIHQAVVALLANRRAGTARTKTRGQVRGGSRKPWRQKGTGRARHGSTRSPIWVGGGVVHGPQPRNYDKRLPRKVRRQALLSAWSMKRGEDRLRVVQSLALPELKTKRAQQVLRSLFPNQEEGEKILVMLGAEEREMERAFRNLPGVHCLPAPHATVYDLVLCDQVLLSEQAVRRLEQEFVGEHSSPSTEAGVEEAAL